MKKYLTRKDIQGWIAYNNLYGIEHQHRHYYGALGAYMVACAHAKKGRRPKFSQYIYESPEIKRTRMLKVQSDDQLKNTLNQWVVALKKTSNKKVPNPPSGKSKLLSEHRKTKRPPHRKH